MAGGRCGGSSVSGTKEDTQGVQTSFSQLLAQREAMDAKLWSAPTAVVSTEPHKTTTAIILAEKQQLNKQKQKEADIQCLLEGDY